MQPVSCNSVFTIVSFFEYWRLVSQGTSSNLCLACCAGIVIEPLFNAFATTAFFEFVVFAIFEMRYLLSVWRARRANALDPWAAQRELSVLYARFYGALLGGIFLTYQLQRCTSLLISALATMHAVCCHLRIGSTYHHMSIG